LPRNSTLLIRVNNFTKIHKQKGLIFKKIFYIIKAKIREYIMNFIFATLTGFFLFWIIGIQFLTHINTLLPKQGVSFSRHSVLIHP